MASKDYYKILGLNNNASQDEIKKAYRKLAMQYHPDRNHGKEEWANEKFKEINEAFSVLGDPEKRRQYEWHSVKGTKKQAEKEPASLINRLETGNYIKPTKTTVGSFLEQWLNDYASTNTAPRTYERNEIIHNLGEIDQKLIPLELSKIFAEHFDLFKSPKSDNTEQSP